MQSPHNFTARWHLKDYVSTRAITLWRIALVMSGSLCGLAVPNCFAETGVNAAQKKLEQTIIPKFEFYNAKPEAALQALSNVSGVSISYTPRREELADVTLSLANIPASEALMYVAKFTCLKVTYKEDGIDVLAERRPPSEGGPLEKKAQGIHLPQVTFKSATPAEVLKALSATSGIKVFYAPAEWDKAEQTVHYNADAPAWGVFHDFANRAHLRMVYGEDAVYFVANPYARNGFQTPGTVEYLAETTAIPTIRWNGVKPAESFKEIAAASGIPIFYVPRTRDKPVLPQMLENASVAYLLRAVAFPAGLSISYQGDGVHLAPGDPNLNEDHANARMRIGLPIAKNLLLEASPEFQAERRRRLDLENAALLEKNKNATLVRIGDAAPNFSCKTAAGEEFTLGEMKDKVVILQFFINNQWAWDTVQKFEKEVLPRYGNRKDVRMLTIFSKLDLSKLDEIVKQKSISYPTAAEAQSEISSRFGSRFGVTYVIGKDGKIKQRLFPSLVFGKASLELEFSAESMQALNQTLEKELAVNR